MGCSSSLVFAPGLREAPSMMADYAIARRSFAVALRALM